MSLRALFLLLGFIAIAGCGRVGPLEPPPPRPGEAPVEQNDGEPKPKREIFLDKLI